MDNIQEFISNILKESIEIIEHIDKYSDEAIIECYNMLAICSKSATNNISSIGTYLRAEICKQQDILLDHIADRIPFKFQADAGIYTPSIQNYRNWSNMELMKDKGLVGYMLANEIGAKSTMFYCSKNDNYTFAEVLPNLNLIYDDTPDRNMDMYNQFLHENYKNMDILILHGIYEQSIPFLNNYRKLRPDGKVYCGLDMNSHWFNRISWNSERIQSFTKQCDMIATSCTKIRDMINYDKNINFACRYIPNGFYNPTNLDVVADVDKKENIIISVGRIGSPEKNHIELITAFIKVEKQIPDWKLKLIGSTNKSVDDFMDKLYSVNPSLRDKIIVTGAIYDKAKLYEEYAKAKIFALPSFIEGGTPNVYAEALFHGCMFITSSIDACDDITNNGELGVSYKIKNLDDLSDKLIYLCNKADYLYTQQHIENALIYANKYYDWNRNIRKLAFALFA